MGDSVTDQMSWSIRLGRGEQGRRVLQALVETVPELLAQHFPASCGYEAQGTRLGGPVEGVRWTITRGPFRGELDVQCYDCVGSEHGSPAARALRVVASAGLRDTSADDSEALERRVVGWAMVGWGLGSVALGTLLLGLGGVAPVWAELLALVPAVAAWRASVSCLVHRAGPPVPALPASRSRAMVLVREQTPAVADGLRRWRELLPALRAQRDLLQAACGQAPFRSVGHPAGASGGPQARVSQVLASAASSLRWPRPALATACDASGRARVGSAGHRSDRRRRTTHSPPR